MSIPTALKPHTDVLKESVQNLVQIYKKMASVSMPQMNYLTFTCCSVKQQAKKRIAENAS